MYPCTSLQNYYEEDIIKINHTQIPKTMYMSMNENKNQINIFTKIIIILCQ